jgi:hypothetical protein
MEPFSNQEGRVSRLTSLATVMHAGLPKTPASSGYKSQRRSRTKGEERREKRGKAIVRRKTGGRQLRRM